MTNRAMHRLSGTDAGFLYGETAAWHMHAGVVVVLDPSTASGGFGLDALRDVIRQRLPELGLFRYRVSAAPLGIGGSYWVEAPELDLEAHVQAASLPAPAGRRELAAFAADVFSRKLDRSRPLWEMWLVEPFEGNLAALVIKVHHACVDGVRGVQLYDVLFDLTADAPHRRGDSVAPPSEPEPSRTALLCATASEILSAPARVGRAVRAVAGAGVGLAGFALSPDRRYATFPFEAKRSRFNGPLTPARSVAFCSLPDGRGADRAQDARCHLQRRRARRLHGRAASLTTGARRDAARAVGRADPGRRSPRHPARRSAGRARQLPLRDRRRAARAHRRPAGPTPRGQRFHPRRESDAPRARRELPPRSRRRRAGRRSSPRR